MTRSGFAGSDRQEPGSEIQRLRARQAELEAENAALRKQLRNPSTANDSRHMATLQRRADLAMVSTDCAGRITEWSDGARALFGWSAEEMRGAAIDRLYTLEDRADGRAANEMFVATQSGMARHESWHTRKDGSRLWAVCDTQPVRAEDGSIVGFLRLLRDRSFQHEADAAHRADAEFLRSILAAAEDCIEVLGLDGRITFTKDGPGDAAAKGSVWTALWPATADATQAIAKARAGGTGHFQADRCIRPGETQRSWDVQVTPIRGADGKPEKLLSVARDITESRQAEQALREAQGLNAPILNSSRDCIVVLDLDANIQLVSPGGIESMEITDLGAVIGKSWVGEWQDEVRESAGHAVAAARAGGIGRFQGFCPTMAGRPKWWDVMISPLPGPDGSPERLVTIGRDVTDRKRAEEQLRRLNETLEQQVAERTRERDRIWNVSLDLLGICEPDGGWLSVNPAWTRTLGWTQAEIVGGEGDWIVHPEDVVGTRAERQRLVAGSATVGFENRVLTRDGQTRWMSWTAVPDNGLLCCIGRDVTAEKTRERQLLETQEALRQAQKMDAVGQLTGGLAHDFNNLLTGISGSLELLQDRLSLGRLSELDRYLASAQSAARRAAALTHRLLAFSRRQTLDPKPVDVNRLIDDMQELVRGTIGPQIELEITTADDLWTALIDPNQLENAALNLCINARDAMPEGGRLTIRTTNRWLDTETARHCDLKEGPYLCLSVADTGCGMTPEIVSRAFDPFFTTKPIGKGTGLGLSMIYGFARQSGGHVLISSEVDPNVGHGSTILLFLPRHDASGPVPDGAAAHPGVAHPNLPRADHGETVLVVDDEPSVRMLVTEVLEDLGYTAMEATDGAGGLALLQSDAHIDLLVTDVGLPGGMNGRQVADAGRALRPKLKVLFITGYAETAATGENALEPGMQVLSKPFTMRALAGRIKELITAD